MRLRSGTPGGRARSGRSPSAPRHLRPVRAGPHQSALALPIANPGTPGTLHANAPGGATAALLQNGLATHAASIGTLPGTVTFVPEFAHADDFLLTGNDSRTSSTGSTCRTPGSSTTSSTGSRTSPPTDPRGRSRSPARRTSTRSRTSTPRPAPRPRTSSRAPSTPAAPSRFGADARRGRRILEQHGRDARSTTAPPAPVSGVTPGCRTPESSVNAVLKGPACALDSIPAALRRTLDRGAKALERAELVRPRRTRMLHAKAKHLLERARRS